VEGAPTADNPAATAGPNDSLSEKKSKHRLCVEQLKLELARNVSDHIRKLATLEKRVTGLKEMVASQRNRISKLEADRKATETKLKAKLRSVQEHPAFFRCWRHSKGIRDRLRHKETKVRL
jgi:peptidoglycan hydrolase CwlO-like protein